MQHKRVFVALTAILAFVSACGPTEAQCNNGRCYDPSSLSCVQDFNGAWNICPLNFQSCNAACYSPSLYRCTDGNLLSGAAAAAKPSTTSAAAAKPSTSAAATKAATTAAAAKSTTSSTTSAATKAPTSAASSCDNTGCGVGLCNCNGACFDPVAYNCASDTFKGRSLLCPGKFSACNGNCYDASVQTCTNGVLASTPAGPAIPATTGTPAGTPPSTSRAATPSTTATPVVANPTPAPVGGKSNFPTQRADLRIINSCKSTLWFEGRAGPQGNPIPGWSQTSVRADPNSYVDYTIPDTGLVGSRFWAKYGCDGNGRNCIIGDQMQYHPNPPGGCPPGGCTPPVDSLFEATWGCKPGAGCFNSNPTTWFDTSQVDGWTIPYKLTAIGSTNQCDCGFGHCGFDGVDASQLSLADCPSGEDLTWNGKFPSVNVPTKGTVNLKSVDLRIISNGQVIGCMSPCKKLNWGLPYGLQQEETSGSTMWMCCPTPNPANCQVSEGCISSPTCRTGPIEDTQFVKNVHRDAPGIYAYSYDDGVGLHACPAGTVIYTMEFCPAGSVQYPLPL